MIKSPVFYGVFVLLEFRRAKRIDFLKAQIMYICIYLFNYLFNYLFIYIYIDSLYFIQEHIRSITCWYINIIYLLKPVFIEARSS